MNKQKFFLCQILIILFLSLNVCAQPAELIPFELKDQFGKHYSNEIYKNQILVIIGSDRGGRTYNPMWGKAIYDSLKVHQLQDSVKIAGLSDLRGVPFFLKNFVRSKFPQNKARGIMLDWKGKIPKAYNFKKDHGNILIFDRAHLLKFQLAVKTVDRIQFKNVMAILINSIKES